ncbi:MAG: hypothetical protein ACRCYU_01810 [Nocardioides sp.]
MDEHEQAVAGDIAAAATVRAAKREVDGAIADLAASPLDEAAAGRMREVLASSKLRRARRVLARIQVPRRPHLSVVSDRKVDRRESRSNTDPEDCTPGASVAVAAGGAV